MPFPAPSTPSKAMNSPVAGGRFSFGTSVRGCGSGEAMAMQQAARVEAGDRSEHAGGPQREPSARQVEALAADVELVVAIDARQDREEREAQEQPDARERRERRERPPPVLVLDVLLQQRVAAHPREAAERAEPHA